MRTSPAVKIMRGPLVLAKAEIVCTPESEMISHESILGNNPELQLKKISALGVWGAWNLTIEGEKSRCIPVCDFISASDEFKEQRLRFSLWF